MTRRDDRAWCTPSALPPEVLAYGADVEGALGVGAAGKLGVLDLQLASRAGTTRVVGQYQRSPLYVYRPIYLDPVRPDMAFVFMQQQGDGLVQGDRYRTDIDCGPGTAVHLTTQAATKVFRARDNFATQLVNLRVGEGAVLEYLPDPVIPFAGSRLYQRTCLTVADDATVILGEVLLPGRTARSEAFDYDLYWADTEARDPHGTLLFSDRLRLRPGELDDPRSPAVLGRHDVLASLYVISPRMSSAALVTELREALADVPDVLSGATELPAGRGAAVRILGGTSRAVRAAMHCAWERARIRLLGAPIPNLRKG
ncbi:urease accessory protein UreD [Kribbella sp. NPDC000426]|uniref:urease accessory protein UreD n=1 Tax=Kribbella sp. NPDC000426 TaxID=3154255 RepID=UPI003321ED41